MKKINFFGTNISLISKSQQIKRIRHFIKESQSAYVTYSNVHVVVTCKNNSDFRRAINNADIASPDGMPLVKIAKFKGIKNIEKCSGPDMMISLIEDGIDKGYKHFFYGSSNDTLNKLVNSLENKYETIKIVGSYSPPYRSLTLEEDNEIVESINILEPDCIWIGLGAPKQELWMYNHRMSFNKGVMFGVGAAFDFHAGTLKRAPLWMQEHSLEWLYRLLKEPNRLWRRYFITNTLFIWYLMKYGVKMTDEDFL